MFALSHFGANDGFGGPLLKYLQMFSLVTSEIPGDFARYMLRSGGEERKYESLQKWGYGSIATDRICGWG